VIIVCALFSQQILWHAGEVLVADEPPTHADIAAVLGGDPSGNRILKACELVKQGFVPHVLVSGEGTYYGTHESELAIRLAVSRGCPESVFTPFRYPAHSTVEEAEHVIPEMRRLGAKRILVVTSPSHTARARRVFRRIAPDLDIHSVASRDGKWNRGYWWKIREGRKLWLLEMTKTIADCFGI
jgi:uncharacterized SAM-binding protein YcdF (DUF218 family)